MMHYRDWPVVLKRKWIMTGAMGLLFLLVGGIIYLTLNDRTLLFISAALVLCTSLRCATLYRTISTGNYEITEGLCIEIGKAGLHQQREVRLLEADGNECAIMLDKRTPVRIGNYYRVYYESCSGYQRKPEALPVSAVRQYLAAEDIGIHDITGNANSI